MIYCIVFICLNLVFQDFLYVLVVGELRISDVFQVNFDSLMGVFSVMYINVDFVVKDVIMQVFCYFGVDLVCIGVFVRGVESSLCVIIGCGSYF